ncbi:DUF397 domain-containing protein [Nocardia cyriacigeorgica]|uniref:DUF397 domain-containing protein n=1 Tax=Nocardia cyriacigeorgica TaxID=135487 RepID=A0A5R8PIW1_9NOCA|nr:DUF397 domain-containing protein [Nocardia cyriacigeorgica]TLG16364.1 DUF397 domain-containing protein [Nocardia cyriacigeorgica]
MDADQSHIEWFKSSYSSGGNECVEIAYLGRGEVGVRDSKNPTGPALIFSPTEWDAFLSATRDGTFNR